MGFSSRFGAFAGFKKDKNPETPVEEKEKTKEIEKEEDVIIEENENIDNETINIEEENNNDLEEVKDEDFNEPTLYDEDESENNEELGVDRDIYYFFDGNENNIKKWKEKSIPLKDYDKYVSNTENATRHIIEMKNYLNSKDSENETENKETEKADELDLIIKYNKSIEYLAKKMKFCDLKEVYITVNEIEKEFRQEREKLTDVLGKIIINAKNSIDGDKLKKLINLKNSIRSNVNVRSILFNFFDLLQEA